MRVRLLLLGALVLSSGCVDPAQRLVGVWKFDAALSGKGESIEGGLATAFAQSTTFEFNAEHRYKASLGFVEKRGEFTVQGDRVTLKDMSLGESKEDAALVMRLSSDGRHLTIVKEFPSDGKFVYTKVEP